MGFYYNFEYSTGDIPMDVETFFSMFWAIMGIVIAFSVAISLVFYVLNSIALMGISKRRGLNNPWLAWIPFCGGYAIGRISDDINRRRGKVTRQRIILLVSEIALSVFSAITLVLVLLPLFQLIELLLSGQLDYAMSESQVMGIMGPILIALVTEIFMLVAAVLYIVFQYIALYNIFKAYDQKNAVLYLVLSIFFAPITTTIFLLMMKNRTPEYEQPQMGYPPYPGAPYQGYQQYYAPPAGQPMPPTPPNSMPPTDSNEPTE